MATKNKHTADLVKLAAEVPALIDALESQIVSVAECMDSLKEAGVIYATEHWRKDGDGQPKYFYLLYPQKQGEPRRREYVGCDAERIEEARAGIVRASEYDKMAAKYANLTDRARNVAGALQDARRHLIGR